MLVFAVLVRYSLTETIAVTSVNLPGQNKLGTVGRPFPGVEVQIAEDGEILMRGRNIMRGYFGLREATAEVIDKEGYFHTGDIVELVFFQAEDGIRGIGVTGVQTCALPI